MDRMDLYILFPHSEVDLAMEAAEGEVDLAYDILNDARIYDILGKLKKELR